MNRATTDERRLTTSDMARLTIRHVVSSRAQRWIAGEIASWVYFAAVRGDMLRRAEAEVTDRLAGHWCRDDGT